MDCLDTECCHWHTWNHSPPHAWWPPLWTPALSPGWCWPGSCVVTTRMLHCSPGQGWSRTTSQTWTQAGRCNDGDDTVSEYVSWYLGLATMCHLSTWGSSGSSSYSSLMRPGLGMVAWGMVTIWYVVHWSAAPPQYVVLLIHPSSSLRYLWCWQGYQSYPPSHTWTIRQWSWSLTLVSHLVLATVDPPHHPPVPRHLLQLLYLLDSVLLPCQTHSILRHLGEAVIGWHALEQRHELIIVTTQGHLTVKLTLAHILPTLAWHHALQYHSVVVSGQWWVPGVSLCSQSPGHMRQWEQDTRHWYMCPGAWWTTLDTTLHTPLSPSPTCCSDTLIHPSWCPMSVWISETAETGLFLLLLLCFHYLITIY